MKKYTFLLAGSVLLLSGCAGVKSSFDCDATTSDTCMTMTKANQLARDKAARQAGKPAAGGLPSLVNLPPQANAQPVPVRSVISAPSPVSAVANPSGVSPSTATTSRTQATAPVRSGGLLSPRPVAGAPVLTTPPVRPVTPVSAPAPSCQTVRCDSPGSVHPGRSQDRIATVWIAPWVDSDNVFHQPGRVSFVADPSDWVLPSRVN
ncbi:type IV conjugative transfer system lipoprotein TraV [Salmonella enterica]|uniref:Type IV conjugative transfer system protein TraV n=1 Tax=Salmonella enterica subsp. enterica serovar Javiana TaxID=363569 RepID=A0A607KAI4_SALET|nr:type IV conjugative transfer system protein TraV [Salmonella enterica]EAR0120309.1 type IV conjugative transfer system protein TraV [Salmonella enterica subsp. enterica serovar Javiana]EBF4797471.1 type IV conjugative transfer system protein TraV [Salmonella enterica subsp. enterica]EDY0542503.1 type IV conjugative transfer system lipoprotein TraV [Salmonella enterica subsp. enterica serovar Panama]EAN6962659.1 type IV conjugative transfer system protein TraV [Salmonella enterica]